MADKQKKQFFTSPKGVLIYPHLLKPDTKFNKEGGDYKAKLKPLDNAAADSLREKIDQATEQAVEKSKAELLEKAEQETDKAKAKKLRDKAAKIGPQDPPYAHDEETGATVFSFKLKAQGKTKEGKAFTQKPHLYNSVGQPIKGVIKVGGGTVAKIGFELVLYYNAANNVAGVSLRLRACQIIELKEFGETDASVFGFGEEEGGFAGTGGDEPEETAGREAEEDEGGDDSDGDF